MVSKFFFLALLVCLLTACVSKKNFDASCYHLNEEMEKDNGFCQAIRIGNTLHVSGTVGQGAMPDAIKQAYDTLELTLKENGLTFKDVVKETIFTTDLPLFIKYKDVRKSFYQDGLPSSSWLGVERLYNEEFVVEIELVAVYPLDKQSSFTFWFPLGW